MQPKFLLPLIGVGYIYAITGLAAYAQSPAACPEPFHCPGLMPPPFAIGGHGPGPMGLAMSMDPGLMPPPGPPYIHRILHAFIRSGIDLTDEQTSKAAILHEELMSKVDPILSRLHSLENAFTRALIEPEIDASRLEGLRKEISLNHDAIDQAFSDHIVKMLKLLTVEQRKQLKLALDRDELGPLGIKKPGR